MEQGIQIVRRSRTHRARSATPAPTTRSRVTNHKDLLPGLDGRSSAARRYRDLVGAFIADMGGADQCGDIKLGLLRRLAAVTVQAEAIEARMVNGEAVDVATLCQLASTSMRLSSRLALRPVVGDRQLSVWVGVDASVKRDSTAIVWVTWDRRAKQVRVIGHRIFQPSADQPLDFELCIEHTLLALRDRFNVRQVWFDPYQMQASAQRLKRERIRIEEFPQSVPNLTEASQNLYELIKGKNLVTYPDEAMRLAVSRAVAVESSRGWRIAKEKQAHKIDVVVALGMACLAAVKNQSSYDSSGAWVGGGAAKPLPEDPAIVQARRKRLYEILANGGQVPF